MMENTVSKEFIEQARKKLEQWVDQTPRGMIQPAIDEDDFTGSIIDTMEYIEELKRRFLNRVEVIVHGKYGNGREFVSHCDLENVTLSFQDDGRTLKIFAERNAPSFLDNLPLV